MPNAGAAIEAMSNQCGLPQRVKHKYAGVFEWDDARQVFVGSTGGAEVVATAYMVRNGWDTLFSSAPTEQQEMSL